MCVSHLPSTVFLFFSFLINNKYVIFQNISINFLISKIKIKIKLKFVLRTKIIGERVGY